jgi:isoquinoline 1-oxidoreductase alpha subunit
VLREAVTVTHTPDGDVADQSDLCTAHQDGDSGRFGRLQVCTEAPTFATSVDAMLDTAAGRTLQRAWHELNVRDCGNCEASRLVTAVWLLSNIKSPTDSDIEMVMSGDSRCGTEDRIRNAIKLALRSLHSGSN